MTFLSDIDDDLSVFYDIDLGFAEDVIGPSGTIVGIFDNDYQESEPIDIPVSGSEPILRTRLADAMDAGDSVTVRSVDYTVIDPQPNGKGEVIHVLRLV